MYLIYPNGPHPVVTENPPEGQLAFEYHEPDVLVPVVRLGDHVHYTEPDGVLRNFPCSYLPDLATFYDPKEMTFGIEVVPVSRKVLARGLEALRRAREAFKVFP